MLDERQMLTIVTRRRPIVLLAAALLAQVLLLALQIRRPGQVRLIRVWAVAVLTPLERAASWGIGHAGSAWNNYVSLHHARRENEELRKKLGDLQMRVGELESRAAEADRLSALLAFRNAHPSVPLVAARIIGSGPGSGHTVYVDRGESDGIQRNMGVITPDGVVGKILEAYSNTAQVLLINEKGSGVGSLLATSRTQGVAIGQGEPLLSLQYIVNDQEVSNGELVLTSGGDRIFPKDLPVGTVVEVRAGNTFKVIQLRPAARLDRLEEVFILLSRAEWESKPAGEVPSAGAAQQKAARP
jgi:rod shape-determining protein MreC